MDWQQMLAMMLQRMGGPQAGYGQPSPQPISDQRTTLQGAQMPMGPAGYAYAMEQGPQPQQQGYSFQGLPEPASARQHMMAQALMRR